MLHHKENNDRILQHRKENYTNLKEFGWIFVEIEKLKRNTDRDGEDSSSCSATEDVLKALEEKVESRLRSHFKE